MSDAPHGTITFLFTDLEGSTRLWERRTDTMSAALERHDEIVRHAIERYGGHVFKTAGDAFHAAFARAGSALRAALDIQRDIGRERWGDTPMSVRCALHSGTAEQRDGDYFGPSLNRTARILAAGYGGQVLLSEATRSLAADGLPEDCVLIDLGVHRLRDLDRDEHIFQLGHVELRAEFPPLKTLRARHDNIPLQRTVFIGRERECAELALLLAAGGPRLITITGPGGCGKTRLAEQVAADFIDRFAHGACFVALAPITDAGLIAATAAQALGLRESERPPEETVAGYLAGKEVLLILDNLEQIGAAAAAVSRLLDSAGSVRVIATSRAPLRVYGEQEFQLLPLPLPESADLSHLAVSDAARLFVERAAAASPGFAIHAGNAAAVAAICRRLDGLPLAIELAAARVKMLPPQALLDRLESRLGVLTGGAQDAPERQRTMRNAIAWSHALLDERERRLFRRLGVFAGGFTLYAAEEVCAFEGDGGDVLDGIASLLDKSLLRRDEREQVEPRLLMLETVREFAIEQLDAAAETAEARTRHAAWATRFAKQANDEIHARDQVAWLAACEREHDNLRAALAWRAGTPWCLELALALTPFWGLHSHLSEGRQWLAQALATAAVPSSDLGMRARGLLAAAGLATHSGDYDAARQLARECAAIAEEIGETALRGRAHITLGWSAIVAGEMSEGLVQCEAAAGLLRTTSDRWGLADALHYLGHARADKTGLESARGDWEESLRIFRELGDGWSQSQPLKDLGLIAARSGDHDAARELYDESLALQREIGNKWHIADTLARLGELALFTGDLAAAGVALDEALAGARDGDNPSFTVEILMRCSEVYETSGDYGRARVCIDEGLATARTLGYDRLVAAALHNLAYIELQEGHVTRAEELFAGATALHDTLERDLELALDLGGFAACAAAGGQSAEAARPYGASHALQSGMDTLLGRSDRLEFVVGQDERIAAIRAQLGETVFVSEWVSGAEMSRDDARGLARALAQAHGSGAPQGIT